jgi:hypothetical protein
MCNCNGRLCNRFLLASTATFAAGTLTINIPQGTYGNGCRYCLVIGTALPGEATLNAPVVITIGEGTEEYPLLNCNGAQVIARNLRTRKIYPVVVATTADGGVFRMLNNVGCDDNRLAAINGTAPAAPAEGGA